MATVRINGKCGNMGRGGGERQKIVDKKESVCV